MVIIHQQATDSGNKFISTVVDTPQDSSFTSSFSLNSQLSISERSALYKQRIDSLFGRPTKFRSSPKIQNQAQAQSGSGGGGGEPFRIRIDGKSISPTAGLMGSSQNLSVPVVASSSSSSRAIISVPRPIPIFEGPILSTSSEDDEYSRLNDNASIITDSLNHQVKVSIRSSGGNLSSSSSQSRSGSNNNVSSVRITCEDSESSGSHLQSLMHTTSSSGEEGLIEVGRSEIDKDKIMWRNSNYGECSSSPGNSGSRIDKPFSTVRCSPGGILKFSVEYLGSVPVTGNTATLQDLQVPLKTLYMNYLSNTNMMTGQLAITSDGLRFEAPKIRLVNPFTTIAVWAAVKFVGRGEPLPTECAFMPLISDPEGQDKSKLFGRMNSELCGIYQGCLKDGNRNFKNPPIFACVMREATFSLDCHAFACKCAEDAIVIAANLYQSLVDKMRTGKEGESGYGSLTRVSPTTQSSINQNRSSSSSSSVAGPSTGITHKFTCSIKPILTKTGSSSSTQNENRAVFSDSESIVPVRPPRKKKKSSDIPSSNLKRYNSDDSVLLNLPYRRRSFRNGYQGHYIKNKKRVQIHTPDDDASSVDSFTDSVDQILDRIVDPCGMSFKDLKPVHQELILKIALTLTQDQLYKKSKQAMKKQQKSRKKQKSASSSAEGSDDNSQFMNQFLKSISKINLGGKSAPISKRPMGSKSPFTTSGIVARQKQKFLAKPQIAVPSKAILKKPKEDDIPFMSFCSGCACDNCSDKCYCSLPKCVANNGRELASASALTPTSSSNTAASTPSQHPACSSTDVPIARKTCGYDTDSCAESEKCYCSLQRVKSNGLKIYNINLDTETSDTDTNSYDLQNFNNTKSSNEAVILNQTSHSQRAVEILSYHPSRRLSYCFSPTSSQKSYAKHGTPTGVPIYAASNREKLPPQTALHRKLNKFKDTNMMENSKIFKNKVLLITGSNASGQVIYKDAPFNKKQSVGFGHGMPRHKDSTIFGLSPDCSPIHESVVRQTSDSQCSSSSEKNKHGALEPDRAVSMKKSAEIAAMFTELKLNSERDFILSTASEIDEMGQQHTHDSTSIDFETSLGYLP